MFCVWTVSAYHSKHCTGRYQDIREDQVDQEQTGGAQSTKTYKRWGRTRGGNSWQTLMASECEHPFWWDEIQMLRVIWHDIMDRIRSCRLRYFGHVVRMQLSRWPHRVLYGRVHGNRHRGRPRKCWTDNISDDFQMMGLSLTQATHEAEDRRQWREYTRLSRRA